MVSPRRLLRPCRASDAFVESFEEVYEDAVLLAVADTNLVRRQLSRLNPP